MIWFLSKKGIEVHEVENAASNAIKESNMSPNLKTLLLSVVSGLGTAVVTGQLTVLENPQHHILWLPTFASALIAIGHLVAQSPLSREVWDDAQRAAYRKLQEEAAKKQ